MKVRALQFRGLGAPHGERRIEFADALCSLDAGSATDAQGLAWLLRALLQPDPGLASLAAWAPGPDARVVAWLAFGVETLRLAIDAPRGRAQLARWQPEAAAFREQSSEIGAIGALFAERCGADREAFEQLRSWGLSAFDARASAAAPSVAAAVSAERERLRAQLERRTALERELAAAQAELEEQAPLAALAEGIEPRIAGFRAALEIRDADRREIEEARRKLLAERVVLRAARGRSRIPFGLGSSALLVGAAVIALGAWPGAVLAGLGAVLAGASLVQLRAAQRRVGRIEAVLAAQRVRERTAEQRFESETEPLRAALAALDLPGVDALRAALDAHRELAKRAAELDAELREARAAELAGSAELARLEAVAARAPEPAPPAVPRADPEALVAAAAGGTGLDPAELRARLAAALPLYLSALSGGALTHARHREGEGWVVRGPGQRGCAPAELPAPLDAQVRLAFQLALAERTAAERDVPFLIGPAAAWGPEPERALRRLAGFVQVIRVGSS